MFISCHYGTYMHPFISIQNIGIARAFQEAHWQNLWKHDESWCIDWTICHFSAPVLVFVSISMPNTVMFLIPWWTFICKYHKVGRVQSLGGVQSKIKPAFLSMNLLQYVLLKCNVLFFISKNWWHIDIKLSYSCHKLFSYLYLTIKITFLH